MDILVIAFYVFSLLSEGRTLEVNCDYSVDSTECKITSLNVPEKNVEVTSIKGEHKNQSTDFDVKELWIVTGVETVNVPTHMCKFFDNMERIDIFGKKISHISRMAFYNCSKVIRLYILFTNLTVLDEDLFEELPSLKELYLRENKLVSLPSGLIAKNSNLTTFNAFKNQLAIIDVDFGPKLLSVNFTGNRCLDKSFPQDIKTLDELQIQLVANCESPAKKKLKEKELTMVKLQSKFDSLTESNANLESEKSVLASRIRNLTDDNTKLNIINTERQDEIEAIKTRNATIMQAVSNQNIAMRINVTKCQTEIDLKVKEITNINASLTNCSAVSRNTLEACRSNLSTTLMNNEQMKKRLDTILVDKVNLQSSLASSQKNLSSYKELVEQATLKVAKVEQYCQTTTKNLTESLESQCNTKLSDENLKAEDREQRFYIYLIILVLTLASTVLGTYVYMRRQNNRALVRQMVNYQVSLNQL